MFDGFFAWLVLPLGMALGWALARVRLNPGVPGADANEAPVGLSGLDGDDSDQAVAALSRAAAVEPGAVELQLTLGTLFRKRGEFDRAIRVHEAVLARPGLAPADAAVARLELAQDYLKSGLLDRAEAILQGLDQAGAQLVPALELLLDLYEQSRDWPQAIETARRLQAAKGQSAAARIAHYWCERAEGARAAGDLAAAMQALRAALDQDPECVRASLALALLQEAAKDWQAAIKSYWRAMQQDGRFFVEAAAAVERCYGQAGDAAGYGGFLDEAEASLKDSGAPALAKARWLQAQKRPVRDHLGAALARWPSREGLLLWLQGGDADEATPASLRPFGEALAKSLKARPRYLCTGCGLQPSVLFWQCPRCRLWGSVVPGEERL